MTAKVVLPELLWIPTTACSSRRGTKPTLVTVHRWAGGTFDSVVSMFKNRRNEVSSTFVYDGSKTDRCAQMMRYSDKPWTQEAWNAHCISFECNDRMWLGQDPEGLRVLARMVAKVLQDIGQPPVWVNTPGKLHQAPNGWCRHADLGALGGGHTQCPTTSREQARQFGSYVRAEHKRGGFRKRWARR